MKVSCYDGNYIGFGSIIETVFGQITFREILLVINSLPPFAIIKNVTLKIPSSEVSKASFRHASDEFGDKQPG
jgi:hypothetical protein